MQFLQNLATILFIFGLVVQEGNEYPRDIVFFDWGVQRPLKRSMGVRCAHKERQMFGKRCGMYCLTKGYEHTKAIGRTLLSSTYCLCVFLSPLVCNKLKILEI